MTHYANIIENKVVNVIVCDDNNINKYQGKWIKLENEIVGIGYLYDQIKEKFYGKSVKVLKPENYI